MTSVTQILDAYTEPSIWLWKLSVGTKKAEAISKEALEVGKTVDLLIQEDIQGAGLDVEAQPEAVQNAIGAWTKFKEKYPLYVDGIQALQRELVAGDLVGHPDIIHMTEVNDIKTSKQLSIRPKWVVQASKYALMNGQHRAAILLLSKATPSFLYIYWENEMVDYFGGKVFDAFTTIFEYEDTVKQMVTNYMELEALGAL